MRAGDRIGGYLLERPLGRGEAGATWIARSASPEPLGSEVVLKILDLGEARNWTGYELFGREVDALKTLSHPGIPRFIESFEDGSGEGSRLVLAMELAEGVDLEAAAEARRFTEPEIESVLAGLADILAYLASLRPPVIHRDVNPRNVLLAPSGRVSLVDFSGAQEALRRAARSGATIIGTAGYIPLEQVSGRASPRSDLYGAAATALFLLTRRNPSELPAKDLKPDLGSLPALGPGLAAVLDSWLEPDESRRGIPPDQAARILRGQEDPPRRARAAEKGEGAEDGIIRLDVETPPPALPSDSRIRILEEGGRLEVSIPRAGMANVATVGMGGFAIFWLGFVAFWTFSAAAMGAPIFFVLFSLPFWAVGIGLGRSVLLSLFGSARLELDPDSGITLNERVLGRGKTRAWPISDLGRCSVEAAMVQAKGAADKELVIEAGSKRVRIGKSFSERELLAVAERINAWRRAEEAGRAVEPR
jgi:eukaryotic-like serine/threonine-protein kinase